MINEEGVIELGNHPLTIPSEIIDPGECLQGGDSHYRAYQGRILFDFEEAHAPLCLLFARAKYAFAWIALEVTSLTKW